jgi:hypothetical protein
MENDTTLKRKNISTNWRPCPNIKMAPNKKKAKFLIKIELESIFLINSTVLKLNP